MKFREFAVITVIPVITAISVNNLSRILTLQVTTLKMDMPIVNYDPNDPAIQLVWNLTGIPNEILSSHDIW